MNANTIIDASDSCNGSIIGQGLVRIDGKFEGKIQTKEMVVVGASGQLKADVEAKEIIIGGTLVGNIKARLRTKIESGARVEGEIQTKLIRIEDGAFFEGQCKMIKS